MTSMQLLLTRNQIDYSQEKEVSIGKRIDGDGKEVDLVCKIKRLPSVEMLQLQQQYAKFDKKGKAETDNIGFFLELIRKCCIDPNFRDQNWHKELGEFVTSSVEAIQAVLDVTEIMELGSQIIDFCGLNKQFEEAYDITKNS